MKRAMTAPWSLLWILGLICSSDSSCSPTSYYKSCWIRRFPGLYVDIEESQRRGAHILKVYQEESALQCSRSCCLTPNFSCNLAVFHFNTTQDSVNCFHLQCATAESCIHHHRGNVILYNVTKGVDPDLLVFGKYFTTNVRVLPHMSSSRLNVSEPLTSDKRHFNYPPNPPVRSTSTIKPPTLQQTTRAVPTTLDVQHKLPQCTTTPTTTTQSISTTPLNPQQTASTNLHTQTISQTDEPDTTTATLNHSLPTPSLVHTTTAHPSSTTGYSDSTLTSTPINEALSSSTTQQPLGLQTTSLQTTKYLATSSQNTFAKTSTLTSAQATSLSKSEEYPETTAQTTAFKTAIASASSQSETSTLITHAYETMQATTAQKTLDHVISTTSQPEMDPMHNPQQTTTTSLTTKPLTSANMPFKTTQISPAYETSTWALQTPTQTSTLSQTKQTISPTIPTVDSATPRPLTLTFTHTRMGNSATTGSLSSSLTAPTSSMMDSQPYPNDTKGYISRNITTGDAHRPGGDGSLTSVWHLAANTVLVALATCATITFGCCCLVFVALSWRGRRRRKGRYRTNLRGKRGSMRLIKYVIVRESS